MTEAHVMTFPNTGLQVLSSLIHFLGVSILAHCLSRRMAVENLRSLGALSRLSLARIFLLLILVDSWLFLFTSGVVVFGAGLELHASVCSLGIYLCIVSYASSKMLIYCFLAEKVHIVWAPIDGQRSKRSSRVYLACMLTLVGYGVLIILLFIGHIAYFRADGACVIGLKRFASIPLLAYDLWTNVFLTALFLYPLRRGAGRTMSHATRRIARRTLVAALVALATSSANILILTIMRGQELGWVCLGSCGTDVVINALALFYATVSPEPSAAPHAPVTAANRTYTPAPSRRNARDGADADKRAHGTFTIPLELESTGAPVDRAATPSKFAGEVFTPGEPLSPTTPGTHGPTTPRIAPVVFDPESRAGISQRVAAFLRLAPVSEVEDVETRDSRRLHITVTQEIATSNDFAVSAGEMVFAPVTAPPPSVKRFNAAEV